MGQIIFVNPNYPEQPVGGIYRWFFSDNHGNEITFYVGRSQQCTLARGVFEAQGAQLTSDGGRTLDSDFIVWAFIKYIKPEGFNCYWEHCSDNAQNERAYCKQLQPLLQNGNGEVLE